LYTNQTQSVLYSSLEDYFQPPHYNLYPGSLLEHTLT